MTLFPRLTRLLRPKRPVVCRWCGEPFVAAIYPYTGVKNPPNANMPCRIVWDSDTPTVCQECVTANDRHDWTRKALVEIYSGQFTNDGYSSYSVSAGAMVPDA